MRILGRADIIVTVMEENMKRPGLRKEVVVWDSSEMYICSPGVFGQS